MTADTATPCFEFKSAFLSTVALLLKSPDLSRLQAELDAQLGDDPDFFDHDALVIDLAAVRGEAIDFAALVTLLRARRTLPVAVRGGSPEQMQAALAQGLAAAPEELPVRAVAAPAPAPAAAPPTVVQQVEVVREVPAPAPVTLVVDKPLRSGQQVYARGRDLVVMAMVNPGAEVIADGHIHVYAPLRGRAIAGARGWAEARIFARDMRPDLVSIAGVYRTGDDPLPDTVWGRAASVRLASSEAGDKLIFEPIE